MKVKTKRKLHRARIQTEEAMRGWGRPVLYAILVLPYLWFAVFLALLISK